MRSSESIVSVKIVDTYVNKNGKKMRVVRIKKKKKKIKDLDSKLLSNETKLN